MKGNGEQARRGSAYFAAAPLGNVPLQRSSLEENKMRGSKMKNATKEESKMGTEGLEERSKRASRESPNVSVGTSRITYGLLS